MNKYFYHFTHLDNLESIIVNGLLCTNKKIELGIGHYNIANHCIQKRRSVMEVIPEDGQNYGHVHDYIPFYFSTRTPMLLSLINQKKVDQPEIIFFGIKTDLIEEKELIFTDGSANQATPPNFFKKIENLEKLNWQLINDKKWGYNSEERHLKMAEVLVKDFEFSFIDHIVVFNEKYRDAVIEILVKYNIDPKPRVLLAPIEGKYFYYTKFTQKDKKNQNLIIGPKSLKRLYDDVNIRINKERQNIEKFKNKNLDELLSKLKNNFCYLIETKGILKLETENDYHSSTVSDHTLEVISNLHKNEAFYNLDSHIKNILLLSAYLHDIGKGPHDKWPNKIQPLYPDHPYDSLNQCQRVLIEEVEELTEDDIRILTLLIGYHDILGDLSKDCRNTIELKNVITQISDLELLYILSQADVLSLNINWYKNLCGKFEEIKNKVLK